MPFRHRLIAALVAACWGFNFLAIDASLGLFPPMFLVALRFAVIAVPTVLLVPRPDVPLRWLLGYGLGFGTLQFLFLYAGMAAGMPTGLASLVLQSSAPFTVALGAAVFRDRVSPRQLAGLAVATAGLALVGWEQAGTATLLPFLLVLAGGFGWAIGNLCNARARASDPWRFMLWMSVVPPVPMLAAALILEGPDRILTSLTSWDDPAAVPALLGLAYTVLIGTLLGSGLWTWLMARHPAGVVAPFSMLVPVVGMSSAWALLGETLRPGEVLGAAVVVAGVLYGSRTARSRVVPGEPVDPSPVPLSR
ncbi:EamA family transporter [Nocardioides insulae]|uniref:EamA family transporter n=1 Tax=Nocardioides insulae TaxID=394734 RepID=UPI0003FDF96A|nr:EamA family transporter [Nocardioides insulae]